MTVSSWRHLGLVSGYKGYEQRCTDFLMALPVEFDVGRSPGESDSACVAAMVGDA